VEEEQFTVEIGDTEVNYAEHPRWVAQALIQDAGDGVDVSDPADDGDDSEE